MHCCSTFAPLLLNLLPTFGKLFVNFLSTCGALFVHFLSTFANCFAIFYKFLGQLLVNFCSTFDILFVNLWPIFGQLLVNFLSTIDTLLGLLLVNFWSIIGSSLGHPGPPQILTQRAPWAFLALLKLLDTAAPGLYPWHVFYCFLKEQYDLEVIEVVSAEDTTSTTSVAQGYLWATPGLLLCTFCRLLVNF